MARKMGTRGVWVATAVMALLAAGCGGGDQDFRLEDIGFSMDLPPGWRQGEAKMAGGFFSTSNGTCFYEDEAKDMPSGNVTVFPRETESLAEHVNKVIEQEKAMTGAFRSLMGTVGQVAGGEAEQEARKAQEALETGITGPTELSLGTRTAYAATFKTPDLATYRVFIEKGSEVIEVIFQVEAADFPRYELVFEATAATIRVSQ